jgi:hypothetical protein
MLSIDEILDRLQGRTVADLLDQLALFDSYDRSIALIFAIQRVSTADALRLFLEWGNSCDAPWPVRSMYAGRLRCVLTDLNLAEFLAPTEREFYNELPAIVPVWLGCEAKRERGLHWTLEQAVAEEFAWGKRCRNIMPTLVSAQIPKPHIFAVFLSRAEAEIVVDPRRLRKLRRVLL